MHKELESPKALQQILQQSIADVESEYRNPTPQQLFILLPLLFAFKNNLSSNEWCPGIVASKAQ